MPRFRLVFIAFVSVILFGLGLVGCTNTEGTVANPQLEEQVLQIIRENPQAIVESVQAYQQQRQEEMAQAQQNFLTQMVENPSTAIGDSPTKGAADKQIVLLEFSDFQCPFCARAHDTVKQFMQKHQDEVTLAYKHLPLTQIHPEALPAAKAAWAAQQQGQFWDYYDALFQQQDKLGEALYLAIAEDLNLDLEQFNRDRTSPAAETAIQEDVELARRLGISGTPFFIMNGEVFSGAVDLSQMERVLSEVKRPAS